jgi:hypothetical protein
MKTHHGFGYAHELDAPSNRARLGYGFAVIEDDESGRPHLSGDRAKLVDRLTRKVSNHSSLLRLLRRNRRS